MARRERPALVVHSRAPVSATTSKQATKKTVARCAAFGRPTRSQRAAAPARNKLQVNFEPDHRKDEDTEADEETFVTIKPPHKRCHGGFQAPFPLGSLHWDAADDFFVDYMGFSIEGLDLKSSKYDFNQARVKYGKETVDAIFVTDSNDNGRYMWRRNHLLKLSTGEKDKVEDLCSRLYGHPVQLTGNLPATLAWSWFLWRRHSTSINWLGYAKSVLAYQFSLERNKKSHVREDWVTFVKEKEAGSERYSCQRKPLLHVPVLVDNISENEMLTQAVDFSEHPELFNKTMGHPRCGVGSNVPKNFLDLQSDSGVQVRSTQLSRSPSSNTSKDEEVVAAANDVATVAAVLDAALELVEEAKKIDRLKSGVRLKSIKHVYMLYRFEPIVGKPLNHADRDVWAVASVFLSFRYAPGKREEMFALNNLYGFFTRFLSWLMFTSRVSLSTLIEYDPSGSSIYD